MTCYSQKRWSVKRCRSFEKHVLTPKCTRSYALRIMAEAAWVSFAICLSRHRKRRALRRELRILNKNIDIQDQCDPAVAKNRRAGNAANAGQLRSDRFHDDFLGRNHFIGQ